VSAPYHLAYGPWAAGRRRDCLRENAIRPDPVYLAAAAHAAEFLRGDNW